MQPLRNTSRDYSLIRSGARRDARYSPERLSPGSMGSTCYSSTRTNDGRRQSWISTERCISPSSPYDGESHGQRRGTFAHSRRSDPSPGRSQDSSSGEYPFPNRSGARSYEDDYRSSHERFSRAVERSHVRPGSPSRSDRRSSGLGHSLDRGYRRVAADYSCPREDQYKPPSRVDRPSAMQSSNGGNHIPLSDRCDGPSPGRRHDSNDDRRRSRSLSPPVGHHSGRRPPPFGESSCDGRRPPLYRGEAGRSSKIDNEPRLSHERRLSQPYNAREDVPVSRDATSSAVSSRGNLRNVQERDPHVGGLLPLPDGTLDEQPASPLASRDAISFFSPSDSGQALHARLNEQSQSSVQVGKTRPANQSPGAMHLGAGSVEPRPVLLSGHGAACITAQSNSKTVKATGSPVSAHSGLSADSRAISIVREAAGSGRLTQRSAASFAATVGAKDDLPISRSNMPEVSNVIDSAATVQTGAKGESTFRSVSAISVESAPPENSQVIQRIDTRVSRWSFSDAQSAVRESQEEGEEGSSRVQSGRVAHERSVQQQLTQKQHAPAKQHQQPKQQSHSGQQQQLPTVELQKHVQSPQQQQKRPHLSPKKQVPGPQQQQPLPKKQLLSGQSLSARDCKVAETDRTISAVESPAGVLGCGPSTRDASSGTGSTTAEQTKANGESVLWHGTASTTEAASLGNNLKKNDTRVTRWSSPGMQPAALANPENGEVGSHQQQASTLPGEKVMQKLQQQPLSQKQTLAGQQPLSKQQGQSGQQQQPPRDSLHKLGQPPKRQPNLQLLTKPPQQQLPQKRQPQAVEQPKKAVAAGAVLATVGHNANSLSTEQQVSESQLATTTSSAPTTVSLQLGLFGSIPPLHEDSCGTANAACEPASSGSLAEVALTEASLMKEEKSARASRWSVESPENREVRSPGSLCSARSDNAGQLQQQQEPHLQSLQGRQQRQEHSEQQLLQRAQDQPQQLGRQPKQHHQSGQLQTNKPKQQQYLRQQQQQRQVLQMQPRISVAGPSSPLLPLPSQCIGGGLLPLPTVPAVVTIPSPFGPLTSFVPITVPVVSTSVTPRGTFQPKQVWQHPHWAAVGHVPASRNMFSNRQQVSYGDLPDLSLSRAVSPAGLAVASSACSTATSTAAAAAVGATTAVHSAFVDGCTTAAAGAVVILSGDTAVMADGATGSGSTATTAGVVATIDGATIATTTAITQAHRTSNASATPFNTVRPVQSPSSALISSAGGLFSSSTSPQAVTAAGGVVDSVVSATSGIEGTLLSSAVYSVSCQPTAVSGLQLAVPTGRTANMLDAHEDGETGLFGNSSDKVPSANIPLNGASSARSREQTIFQSASDSKAAPEQESSVTVARTDEIAIVSEVSAGVVASSCLDPHVDTGKSKVYCPSSTKIVRVAEGSLTRTAEAQETGLCRLSVNAGTLPPPTMPLVVERRSNDSLNFEVPAVAAISDTEKQSVQGDTSAIATPSSPSLKQYTIGVSVRTAHVKPMRKCSTLVVDSCTEEPPLSVPTSLLHCDSMADTGHRHTLAACDSVVAVSSDAGAESRSEWKTTGNCKERLDCKTVLSSEVLPVTSSSESSTPANLCLQRGTSAQGCSVTQEIKNRSEDDPTDFVAHLELVTSEEYRHAEMIQPADAATVSVNRDGEVGSVREEPGNAVTPDLGNSPATSLLPKELAKPVVTEPSSGVASAVAPPVLGAVRERDADSSDTTFLDFSPASMCGMKRVCESNRHEESSEMPSKRRREMDKKINEDEKCEGKCSQALEEQDMDSSEGVASAQHNTFSNHDDPGCQDTTLHAKQSGSRCTLDHNTVSGDIVSGPTNSRPIVSSDSIPDVFSATSIMLGLVGNETGRAIPEQAHNDAVNLSDSRLRELLLAHLQNAIDSGVGPFAAVKESRDAALRYYNSFRERFEKVSADLEQACRRLSEPPQVVEAQHSTSELDVVSTQRTRPRVRTVGTQIRTCQGGGPTGAVPVCAMCSTRFQLRNSQLPTSSSTQGSRNSLDTHGVVDLTVDEMPVSPSKSVQPAQSNEAKSGTFGVSDVPRVAHSITRLTTEPHSPALVSTVTVSSGSMSAVTAAAVVGATTTSFGSTGTAVASQQANNAFGVRCDPAIPGEQSGAAGMPGYVCDKRPLPIGRNLTPRSVLNTVGSIGTAKAIQAQLLPGGPPSLSTSCGVRPLTAGLPGSNSASLPADNNPEGVNRMLTEHLGTETTLSALAVPSIPAAQMDSGLEANGKNLDADESLDTPSVGGHARHLRVGEPQQLSSEKAAVSTEIELEKKQEESQPLIVEEMPRQPENAVVVHHDVPSKPSDKADFSTSETASPRSPLVQWPPPLPSDSDEELAVSGHNGRRPTSPYLEAKWTSDGLELQWNMDLTSCLNTIVKYEVFASKDKSDMQSSRPWTKIGTIDALPLPMSCCLNHLKRSTAYCFAVRAVDSEGVAGTFSSPRTADLCE